MNRYGFKPTVRDLSGKQFGLWTVVKLAARNKKRENMWLCRCKCGTERLISTYSLEHGKTYGCIKCAHKEGRAGQKFNAKGSFERAIVAVKALVDNGYPLDDVLKKLNEEQKHIKL